MERVVLKTGFILTILAFNCALALAIPAEGSFFPLEHGSVWGFEYNQIFLRDFNKVEGKASTRQQFLAASFALTDRFFLDGKIGMGNIDFERNDDVDLSFPAGFAGGYGFRYLWLKDELPGWESSFGFQHISCHPFSDEYAGQTYHVIWDEWQGTLLLIKRFDDFSVYCGPQYNATQLKYKVEDFRRRLWAEDYWGWEIGADYKIGSDSNLNLEFRFLDEWAVNVGVAKRF